MCEMSLLPMMLAAAFRVVLPDTPQPWERTAAEELESVFSACADEGLTVEGEKDVRFHVGDTKLADEKGLLSASLQDEEWVVKSFGRDVVVNGGGSHGALYAVSHFLEDVCGVRWLTPATDHVPKAKAPPMPACSLQWPS